MGKTTYNGLRRTPHRRQWSTKSSGKETDPERRNRLHLEYWWRIACGLDDAAERIALRWSVEGG